MDPKQIPIAEELKPQAKIQQTDAAEVYKYMRIYLYSAKLAKIFKIRILLDLVSREVPDFT